MKRTFRIMLVTFCVAITFIFYSQTTYAQNFIPWSKNKDGQFINGEGKVIEGATMKGIDVSKWNGNINWKKVSATDVDYAIIRCGYGDDYESQDDQYFEKNVKGCEDNDIPYGVYIYSYAQSVAQANSEVNHVLRMIEGHTLNFPIYFDVEDKTQESLPKTKLTRIINTFVNAIHNKGYEVGIYANLNWWTNYIDKSIADNLTWYKWVAQYNNFGTAYEGVYQMWQCTDSGVVKGIKGKVDLNFWYGDVRTRAYNARSIKLAAPIKVARPGKASIKKLKAGKKKVTVKLNKTVGCKGYRIQYSTNRNFKGKVKKSTKSRTITFKKLKSKKVYYFRVKAYNSKSGKTVYSKDWSKVKKIKVK